MDRQTRRPDVDHLSNQRDALLALCLLKPNRGLLLG